MLKRELERSSLHRPSLQPAVCIYGYIRDALGNLDDYDQGVAPTVRTKESLIPIVLATIVVSIQEFSLAMEKDYSRFRVSANNRNVSSVYLVHVFGNFAAG